jgi:hypothetical protein
MLRFWRLCDHQWVRFFGAMPDGADLFECLRCGAQRRRRRLPPEGFTGEGYGRTFEPKQRGDGLWQD